MLQTVSHARERFSTDHWPGGHTTLALIRKIDKIFPLDNTSILVI